MDAPITALILAAKAGAGPERWLEPERSPTEQFWYSIRRVKIDQKPPNWMADYWRERLKNCTSIRSIDYVPAPTWTELPMDPRR